jgi:hypothetical protein
MLLYFDRPVANNLISFEAWASQPRIAGTSFKPDNQRDDVKSKIRRILSSSTEVPMARIEGQAGVGKTRLAFECLNTPAEPTYTENVLYAPSHSDLPYGLLHWVSTQPCTLTLVIDECPKSALPSIVGYCERANSNLKVISVGLAEECRTFDDSQTNVFLLGTLTEAAMNSILTTAYPLLTNEALGFVMRWASGFVKLAVALAENVLKGNTSAVQLSNRSDVRQVIDSLLPDAANQRAMMLVSLLNRVGWEGDVEAEGECVSRHLGLEWTDAKLRIGQFYRQGLISKQGRYRYVTPHILAVWLASRTWDDLGFAKLVELIVDLPTISSRRALLERIRDLGDNDQATKLCENLLSDSGPFNTVESINDELRATTFAVLCEAHPRAGLRALERIIFSLPRDELLALTYGRRQIVVLLERLAYYPEWFSRAANLLLALADAENESWANNAGGTWVGLFGTHLGGTAVPAKDRHALILQALNSASSSVQLLAVRAINHVFAVQEVGPAFPDNVGGRVLPARWHPISWQEDTDVRMSGLRLIDLAISSQIPEVSSEARKVFAQSIRELMIIAQRSLELANEITDRIVSAVGGDSEYRKDVRHNVEFMLTHNSPPVDEQIRSRLEDVLPKLIGDTFSDRLRRWAGDRTGADADLDPASTAKADGELETLATETLTNPGLLIPELDWLASNDAQYVYSFGLQLGRKDNERFWWTRIEPLVEQQVGYTLASSYLQGRVDSDDRDWRNAVLDHLQKREITAPAVLDAVWRSENPSDDDGRRLIQLAKISWISKKSLGILIFGGQIRKFSVETVKQLVAAAIDDESHEGTGSALALLENLVTRNPEIFPELKDLAWTVLSRENALYGDTMNSYYANKIAEMLIPDEPLRVAKLVVDCAKLQSRPILREHEAIRLLEKSAMHAPVEVFDYVISALAPLSSQNYGFFLALQGWFADIVSEDVVLSWARQHIPEGPRLIATLTNVAGIPLHSLARQLLIHFDDEEVRNALSATICSGNWMGELSQFYKSKLKLLVAWADDPVQQVRDWASNLIEALEREIEAIILQEEEQGNI